MMARFWKTLKSEYLLRSRWMNLRKDTCVLPSGHKVDSYFVVERPDCVGVVALTEANKLLLLKQYRHPIQGFVLEFPAGSVEHGKTPAEAAAEELRQETGYAAKKLIPLGTLLSDPSRQTLTVHCFLALGCARAGAQALDPTEHIEVSEITFAKAEQLIRSGELRDGLAVASYHLAKDWLRRNKR
ncbi:MAG TPA: NUDIX hydrolase [archaeon]|nr:NUDIX hydrolase [archaeon]